MGWCCYGGGGNTEDGALFRKQCLVKYAVASLKMQEMFY